MFKINSIKFAANKMAIIIIFQLSAFLQICQLNFKLKIYSQKVLLFYHEICIKRRFIMLFPDIEVTFTETRFEFVCATKANYKD